MAIKKAPAKKTPAMKKKAPVSHLTDGVRIRMYRQGLGDCFLLTFGPDDHMLIDCGLLAGTPDGVNKISAVARHVAQTTKGHLRALVVTHEHWDHVSGFSDARDEVFEKMKIDEVWVAWTEDPSQDIAKEADKTKKLRLAAIGAAVEGLARSSDPADWTHAGEIAETLGFFGGAGSVLGAVSVKTDDAMDWVTDPKRKRTFWSPGDIFTRDWLGGIKIHVLGPPKDKKQLHDLEGNKQTGLYGMAFGLSGEELGMTSALGVDPDAPAWSPFDLALCWNDERDWLEQFHEDFRKNYKKENWRRVDTDWLGAASDMALQLDNATNNT